MASEMEHFDMEFSEFKYFVKWNLRNMKIFINLLSILPLTLHCLSPVFVEKCIVAEEIFMRSKQSIDKKYQ